MKLKIFFLVFTFGILAVINTSAQDNEAVIITVDTLSQNVYMLTGQGGNIGIYVGKTNVFMIDDQFARLSDKIKTAIDSLTKKPLATLFNTHMHGDHSGGHNRFYWLQRGRRYLPGHHHRSHRLLPQPLHGQGRAADS